MTIEGKATDVHSCDCGNITWVHIKRGDEWVYQCKECGHEECP